MRWISEKTGVAVTQVQPNAVVRLEVGGAVAIGGLIRVVEEPELALRTLLRKLGTNTRRPVTTLRWDPSAAVPRGGVRSEPWYAVHLPPAETVTRLVARVGRSESPPLLVGGPVHVTFSDTRGYDAKLGAPVVPAVKPSIGAQRSKTLEISGTAFGAIDPEIRIRALTAAHDLFVTHYARALEETSVRFRVSPWLLEARWRDSLTGFAQPEVGASDSVDMVLEEGERRTFSVRLGGLTADPIPFSFAVLSPRDDVLAMSELGIAEPSYA